MPVVGYRSMRLAARWARPSRSLALRQNATQDGWLIGLNGDRYIIQVAKGEAEVGDEEARRILLQLCREPADEHSLWVAFDDPEMDAYIRELDAR